MRLGSTENISKKISKPTFNIFPTAYLTALNAGRKNEKRVSAYSSRPGGEMEEKNEGSGPSTEGGTMSET